MTSPVIHLFAGGIHRDGWASAVLLQRRLVAVPQHLHRLGRNSAGRWGILRRRHGHFQVCHLAAVFSAVKRGNNEFCAGISTEIHRSSIQMSIYDSLPKKQNKNGLSPSAVN